MDLALTSPKRTGEESGVAQRWSLRFRRKITFFRYLRKVSRSKWSIKTANGVASAFSSQADNELFAHHYRRVDTTMLP